MLSQNSLISVNWSLQGKNKIISPQAKKVFVFEKKQIYYEEILYQILYNLPTITNDKIDVIDISHSIISNHLDARFKLFHRIF